MGSCCGTWLLGGKSKGERLQAIPGVESPAEVRHLCVVTACRSVNSQTYEGSLKIPGYFFFFQFSVLDYSPLYSLLAFGFKASREKCDDARTQAAYRTLWKILPPRQRTSAFLGFWKTRLGINFISSALLFAGLAVTGARQEKDLCLISLVFVSLKHGISLTYSSLLNGNHLEEQTFQRTFYLPI